jgi:hypothetical protein
MLPTVIWYDRRRIYFGRRQMKRVHLISRRVPPVRPLTRTAPVSARWMGRRCGGSAASIRGRFCTKYGIIAGIGKGGFGRPFAAPGPQRPGRSKAGWRWRRRYCAGGAGREQPHDCREPAGARHRGIAHRDHQAAGASRPSRPHAPRLRVRTNIASGIPGFSTPGYSSS